MPETRTDGSTSEASFLGHCLESKVSYAEYLKSLMSKASAPRRINITSAYQYIQPGPSTPELKHPAGVLIRREFYCNMVVL